MLAIEFLQECIRYFLVDFLVFILCQSEVIEMSTEFPGCVIAGE